LEFEGAVSWCAIYHADTGMGRIEIGELIKGCYGEGISHGLLTKKCYGEGNSRDFGEIVKRCILGLGILMVG